jgi:GTP-binding protein LepA
MLRKVYKHKQFRIYIWLENDLEIIPVLNKVDLPSANPEEVSDDIVDLLGCKLENYSRIR